MYCALMWGPFGEATGGQGSEAVWLEGHAVSGLYHCGPHWWTDHLLLPPVLRMLLLLLLGIMGGIVSRADLLSDMFCDLAWGPTM